MPHHDRELPPTVPDQIAGAYYAAEKLVKKARQLVNAGALTEADLSDARAARECITRILARRAWERPQ